MAELWRGNGYGTVRRDYSGLAPRFHFVSFWGDAAITSELPTSNSAFGEALTRWAARP